MRCDTAVVASLALAASALCVCGCAANARYSPPAATVEERQVALDRYYDLRWQQLAQQIDGLDRPDLDRIAIVADDDWANVIELCIGEVASRIDNDRAFEIALLACQEQYPSQSMFDAIRSEAQLDYLYGYYATFVEPCLALTGYDIPPRPTREEFSLGGGYTWNVYQGNRSATDKLKQLLLRKCPPPPQ